MFKRFFSGEEGASMTEYALLLALIAIAAVGILAILGTQVSNVFQAASDELPAAAAP